MSVRRHLAWVGIAQVLYLAMQFASSVVIARLLTPYELGVYTVALATAGLISLFQEFGLYGFVVREPEMSPELVKTIFTINAGLSFLLAGLIAAASTLGSLILHERGVREVLLVIAITPILNAFYFIPETRLQRAARFKALSIISMLRTFAAQALAVWLAFQGYSYMSLAYSQVFGAALSLITYNLVGREFVVLRPALRDWRRVTSYGLHMLAISGVSSATDRLTDFVLAKVAGLAALGLYSRATNLNNLLWENVHLVSGKVVFVDLAESKRNGQPLGPTYIRINDINTVLLWPAFLGLAITSGPFIRLVYGERWVAAAHPLALISLASMVYVSLSMTWDIFVLGGRTGQQARLESVRSAFTAVAFTVGSLFGLTGAAASRLVSAVFTNELYRPSISAVTGTRLADFAAIYARNAFITAGAVFPAAAVMAYHHGSERTPLPAVLGGIAIGVIVWVLLLFTLDHPLSNELAQATQRLLRLSGVRAEKRART